MTFKIVPGRSRRFKSSLRQTLRRVVGEEVRRKVVCLALMLALLSTPGIDVALKQTPVLASAAASATADVTANSFGLVSRILRSLFGSKPSKPQKDRLADRLGNVARLPITPLKYVGYQSETVIFSAVPTDFYSRIVQGVKVTWESSDTEMLEIDDAGRATLLQPGVVIVTCSAGLAKGTAPVMIRPGSRPQQSDAAWRADQARVSGSGATQGASGGGGVGGSIAECSGERDGSIESEPLKVDDGWGGVHTSRSISESTGTGAFVSSFFDSLFPTAHAQSGGGYWGTDFPYDELWSEARNLIGSPRNGVVEPTRIGPVIPEASNFNMAIPIASLGGRGLGASVGLFYNSRLWSRHGNAVTWDALSTWPGPGFTMGFGRIVAYGPTNATHYILIDPTGTRRYLGVGTARGTVVTLKTNDGTNITYVGSAYGGTVYYPGGARAVFTFVNNRTVASQITDSNGNYVSITYLGVTCDAGCPPCDCPIYWPPLAIDHVTDSLGRIIQFNYDANQNLTSITAPGLGGTAQNPVTQTVAQFDYESRSVSGNFSGLTVENRPISNVNFLKHVYFPATQTGVLFNYTAFGMVYNVSTRRQMTINNGVISDGLQNASVAFNYQQGSTPALAEAPAFTTRTETPGGTFSYSSVDDGVAQTKTMIVTLPDTTQQQPVASELRLTRSTSSAALSKRVVTQAEIKRGSTSFAKAAYNYANDPGGSPQVQSVVTYNDLNQAGKVDFDYDAYGNVLNKREYGFQSGGNWNVQRRTHLTYKTDTAYINEYLRNLVTQIEILDGLDNVVAKSATSYDDYAALGGMENYQGLAAPPGHLSNYDVSKTVRGNSTGTTEWSDITGNIYVTRLNKRDIFGNVVKAQVSCCSEKSFTFTEATYWSSPEDVTSGITSGVHLTSSADYDFNTGVTNTQTNPNNQTTSFTYDAALRNTAVTIPTGAIGGMNFYDSTLSSSSFRDYWEDSVHKIISTSSVRDGWGRTIQQVSIHDGQVNTVYDAMGRVQSVTNPFAIGGQPGPATTYQYDSLGRSTVVALPDGNTIQNTFSGNTVTVTDQVNRKTKRENDGLGRLVKVTEQDATGALTQETTYSYNVLDKLTEVNQGGQYRKYKYDALGRLLYEKIPEKNDTIIAAGGTWTCKYIYTDFDAVDKRTDARGVVTTYGYDTLHRLTSVSYDTTNAQGVAATPNVTCTYDTNSQSATNGLLLSISVGSFYQESYSYDGFERVSAVAHTIEGRSYPTNYQYNEIGQRRQVGHVYPGYDSKGRLVALRSGYLGNSLAWQSNMTYNVAGQPTGDTIGSGGGATNETFGYDPQRLRINSQTAVKGATTLMSLTYSYQAQAGQNGAGTTAGNVGQLMSVSGTINQATESAGFTYDLLGRLATSSQTMNGTSSNRKFAYERWGNRTSVWDDLTGTHQIQSLALQQNLGAPTNRLTSVTTNGVQANYLYDPAGNVLNDGAHTYVYDGENRVASADGGAQTFAYDQKNRRVKKVSGGATTHFVWEGIKVLGEYNGSTGSLLTQYVGPGGRLIARISGAVTRYYLSDRLSERLVLDVNGNVVGQQAHLPYGEATGGSGEQEKHNFTTYETDSETGLDYAVNRYDNPNLGRFTTADPMAASAKKESPQSFNRYSYTTNDPINAVDPTGLFEGWPEEIDPCDEGGVTALFGSASLAQFCIELLPLPETPETGPEQTQQGTCKITVRADKLTPGNALSFAFDEANPTKLGESSVGVEGAGWFFRLEAHGTLTGDYRGTATQWHLDRTQELYDRALYRLPDGTFRPGKPIDFPPGTTDGPTALIQRNPGASDFFNLDAPGSYKSGDGEEVWNRTTIWNFTFGATRVWGTKTQTCEQARYHVKLTVVEGVGKIEFGQGHIPIPR